MFQTTSTLWIFEPDHVLATLARYEDIFVTIPIQIGDHSVVSHLVATENVAGEVALAIVLVPDGKLGFVPNRTHVDVSISINITEIGRVSGIDRIVNHMLLPSGGLEPKDPHPMASGGQDIDLAIPVHVCGRSVGGSEVLAGTRKHFPAQSPCDRPR